MQIPFDDRTQIKNYKKEKSAWRKCASQDGYKELTPWIRYMLNSEASIRGFIKDVK